MKYLISGGAGFIGSNLVENLVNEGHQVIVVDNLSTGNLDNLKDVIDKIVFLKMSSGDVLNMQERCKLFGGIDGIFHLGMTASSILLRDNHFLTGQDISDFIALLELAKEQECKIVFNSTSSIYNGNQTPYNETQTIFVEDFYSEVRYILERLALLYNKLFGVKSIALRPFSVYGPHEESKGDRANLVSQFLWAMKENKQPTVWGDGSHERDLVHVNDWIRAAKLAMNSEIECDVINIGSGEIHTINDIIATINKVLNKDIKAKFIKNPLEGRAYFAKHHLADTTKAENVLGFKTEISLMEGIKLL
jgi:UDP-glucose 4-epimerase